MAKKNGWFFNKNLLEDINEFTNEEIEQEQTALENELKDQRHFEEQLHSATQRQEEYQADNRRLSRTLEDQKEVHNKQLQAQSMQLKNYEQLVEEQRQENQRLAEKLLAYEEGVESQNPHDQREEIQRLHEQVGELLLERDRLESSHQFLEETNQNQKTELAKLKQQLGEADQEIQQLKEERATLQKQLKEQSSEINQLEERVRMEEKESLEQYQMDKDTLNEELSQAQEEITQLESQRDDWMDHKELIEKNRDLEAQLIVKEREIDRLLEATAQDKEQRVENEDQVIEAEKRDEKVTELTKLCDQLQKEKAEVTRRLQTTEEVLKQKNQQLQQLEDLLVKKSDEVTDDPEVLAQAQRQIDELIEKNTALKAEVTQSQLEIGEVLFAAKKQANRTIEEAQIEAKHLMDAAELEVETIGNRAKKILLEVTESKGTFLELYEDLERKVEQLAKGALFGEKK